MTEVNVPKLLSVLAKVEEEASKGAWDQSSWGKKTPCGTAFCFAGWTVALDENWEINWVEELGEVGGYESVTVINGQELPDFVQNDSDWKLEISNAHYDIYVNFGKFIRSPSRWRATHATNIATKELRYIPYLAGQILGIREEYVDQPLFKGTNTIQDLRNIVSLYTTKGEPEDPCWEYDPSDFFDSNNSQDHAMELEESLK